MKQKILTMLLLTGLTASMLAGCGQTENKDTTDTQATETMQLETTEEPTEEPTATPEEQHTHNYTETVTTEPSCETDGLKTFSCECGNTYTEPISATGHIYENYTFNNDATYSADGTETATCICGLSDTRTAQGTKLEYTYTDMQATMYAQKTINVRDLPSTDGNKLGSLSTNDEVKVTGQADTGWYRIEYNGGVGYVSNNYLGNNKVEVAPPTPEPAPLTSNVPNALDYPRGVWHDMGTYKFYLIAYRSSREMGQVQYNVTTYEGMGCIGIHLNTSEDLWALVAFTNSKDSALNAFIKDNQCKCGEPTHGGLYPERGR